MFVAFLVSTMGLAMFTMWTLGRSVRRMAIRLLQAEKHVAELEQKIDFVASRPITGANVKRELRPLPTIKPVDVGGDQVTLEDAESA